MAEGKKEKNKENKTKLVLPRYMMLAKGGMWKDTEGEFASGLVVYAFDKVYVGKNPKSDNTDVVKDQFDNKNLIEYGYITKSLPWYIDLTNIPTEKLSRVIIAYKNGVLVKADPNNPPIKKPINVKSDWKLKEDGALVFDGKNKEMYRILQNKNFEDLKKFILAVTLSDKGRDDLMDLLDYERRGFNLLSRPRHEVITIIRDKLREMGHGMSPIRRNEDKE